MERICIGNDHGGYELKLAILDYLRGRKIPVENVGSDSTEIDRYPYYASLVAEAIVRGEADRGILICSTGIGTSIVANKFRGIRAMLCASATWAHYQVSQRPNVLCLGRISGVFEALDILDAWLNTRFEGGRHSISIN